MEEEASLKLIFSSVEALVWTRTHIVFGGPQEVALKIFLGSSTWPVSPKVHVPSERKCIHRGKAGYSHPHQLASSQQTCLFKSSIHCRAACAVLNYNTVLLHSTSARAAMGQPPETLSYRLCLAVWECTVCQAGAEWKLLAFPFSIFSISKGVLIFEDLLKRTGYMNQQHQGSSENYVLISISTQIYWCQKYLGLIFISCLQVAMPRPKPKSHLRSITCGV